MSRKRRRSGSGDFMLQHGFLLVGLIFLLPSLYFFIQLQIFAHSTVPTTATVIKCERTASDSNACSPSIRFLTAKEEVIDTTPLNLSGSFSTGQKVSIRYDPTNPHDAHVASDDTYLYVVILFFMLLGALFTAGGLFAEYMGAKGAFDTPVNSYKKRFRSKSKEEQRSEEFSARNRGRGSSQQREKRARKS